MRSRKTFVAILAIGLFLSTGKLNASAENSNPSEVISKNLLTGEETTVSVSDVQALLEEAGASTSSYEGSGEIDMQGGQSGSPLYKYDSEKGWQAIGINRGETSTFNRAVRITEGHFNLLLNTY